MSQSSSSSSLASSSKKASTKTVTSKGKSTLKLSTLSGERKAMKPPFSATAIQPPPLPFAPVPLTRTIATPSIKGKEKESVSAQGLPASLWVDIYEPRNEEELVVHKKKVEAIRNWFNESLDGGVVRKYRRILALTGPAGAGKTATVRILAQELDLELIEWENAKEDLSIVDDLDRENLSSKFQNFLTRAASFRPLHATTSTLPRMRRAIVLEDLPNILHPTVLQSFRASLVAFMDVPLDDACPLVIIISDAGTRGEDEDLRSSFSSSGGAINIRTVLPPQLLNSQYVTHIAFNPVAPTRMRKALQELLSKAGSTQRKSNPDLLEVIVSSSAGDIRSAIMNLQFVCVVGAQKKGKRDKEKAVLEAITKRENALALFHLLGKLLYNKRKGDAPSSSLSAKEVERERESDKRIPDQPILPAHLREEHARSASRVDINVLYADSPVDSSLLSLYLYQNYTQYCVDVEHCEGVSESLSMFDVSSLPDQSNWLRASPQQFHLLTLGVLHALPTPVPRRGQKMYKPELFDVFRRTHDASYAARDVCTWLGTGWTQTQAILELGPVLAARDRSTDPPPSNHELFSRLKFESKKSGGRAQALDEDEVIGDDDEGQDITQHPLIASVAELEKEHGWLEGDDIEEA